MTFRQGLMNGNYTPLYHPAIAAHGGPIADVREVQLLGQPYVVTRRVLQGEHPIYRTSQAHRPDFTDRDVVLYGLRDARGRQVMPTAFRGLVVIADLGVVGESVPGHTSFFNARTRRFDAPEEGIAAIIEPPAEGTHSPHSAQNASYIGQVRVNPRSLVISLHVEGKSVVPHARVFDDTGLEERRWRLSGYDSGVGYPGLIRLHDGGHLSFVSQASGHLNRAAASRHGARTVLNHHFEQVGEPVLGAQEIRSAQPGRRWPKVPRFEIAFSVGGLVIRSPAEKDLFWILLSDGRFGPPSGAVGIRPVADIAARQPGWLIAYDTPVGRRWGIEGVAEGPLFARLFDAESQEFARRYEHDANIQFVQQYSLQMARERRYLVGELEDGSLAIYSARWAGMGGLPVLQAYGGAGALGLAELIAQADTPLREQREARAEVVRRQQEAARVAAREAQRMRTLHALQAAIGREDPVAAANLAWQLDPEHRMRYLEHFAVQATAQQVAQVQRELPEHPQLRSAVARYRQAMLARGEQAVSWQRARAARDLFVDDAAIQAWAEGIHATKVARFEALLAAGGLNLTPMRELAMDLGQPHIERYLLTAGAAASLADLERFARHSPNETLRTLHAQAVERARQAEELRRRREQLAERQQNWRPPPRRVSATDRFLDGFLSGWSSGEFARELPKVMEQHLQHTHTQNMRYGRRQYVRRVIEYRGGEPYIVYYYND